MTVEGNSLSMRILVNTASTLKGGGVQVALSFLRECIALGEHHYGVIVGPGLNAALREEEFPENFEFFRIGYRPAQRLLSFRGPAYDLRAVESTYQPDVVFTTTGPSYWRPNAPHLMGFNLPHPLYPESPYFAQILNRRQRLRWYAKCQAIRYFTHGFADGWVVQTDDANRRLGAWIERDQVFTVPNTISSAYSRLGTIMSASKALESMAEGNFFRILILSSYHRHKNLEILNDIIPLMRERAIDDIRFVLTLPTEDFNKVILPEHRFLVDNVGPQLPESCPALYQATDALFLPTLMECFSANYVEAMAMRPPIITTDLGFARAICGEAALYFQPLNPRQALARISELRANPGVHKRLVENGAQQLSRFGTSRERAGAFLALCRDLVERTSNGSER